MGTARSSNGPFTPRFKPSQHQWYNRRQLQPASTIGRIPFCWLTVETTQPTPLSGFSGISWWMSGYARVGVVLGPLVPVQVPNQCPALISGHVPRRAHLENALPGRPGGCEAPAADQRRAH